MTHTIPTHDAFREAAQYFDGPHGQIAWWREGRGRPLLLIHGFPTSSHDWRLIWPALLDAGRDVIALDMLGFGLSDKPVDHVYDMLEQTDLHCQLMGQLGLTECDILAHDYGVSIAQELLARQADGELPFKIGKTAFLNGGLIAGQHRPRLVQRLLQSPLGGLVSALLTQERFYASFSAVFGPDTQPSKQDLADFWELVSHKNGQRLSHKLIRYMADRRQHKPRWVGILSQTDVPLRLINGGLDPVSGAHLADAYEALLDDPDIVRLTDVGHYPQWEAPERVAEAVIEFLA